MNHPQITTAELLAAASDVLVGVEYHRVISEIEDQWPSSNARLFEDEYGIVAIVAYDTWRDLAHGWSDAQSALTSLISKYVRRDEPKSWEGYLVLMTPSPVAPGDEPLATHIRYDTSRVRKLLVTADDVQAVGEVKRMLLPLLPLESEFEISADGSTLDALPEVLTRLGIPHESSEIVIDAFKRNQPVIPRLHEIQGSS